MEISHRAKGAAKKRAVNAPNRPDPPSLWFLSGLRVFFGGGFELGHDLKDAVAALLGFVKFEVKFGGIFNVESLVDFRLPFLLEGIQVVEDLLVRGAPVEVRNKNGGMPEIGTDIDPGDGQKHPLQGALPADETGENAAD